MTTLTPYRQTRIALNDILDYVCTDAFIELPEEERRVVLDRLRELVKAVAVLGY